MGDVVTLPRSWINAPESELRARGRRSEPGKGEMVDIYLIHPFDPNDGVPGPYWEQARGEDFAVCWADIVVKAKREVSRDELIRCLEDFVRTLRKQAGNTT